MNALEVTLAPITDGYPPLYFDSLGRSLGKNHYGDAVVRCRGFGHTNAAEPSVPFSAAFKNPSILAGSRFYAMVETADGTPWTIGLTPIVRRKELSNA